MKSSQPQTKFTGSYKKECMNIRSSHRRCSLEKGVLRNFAKFTGKRLCQSLFLIKLQAPLSYRNQSTDLWNKSTFFTEQLWTTTSGISKISKCSAWFDQPIKRFFKCLRNCSGFISSHN